MMCENCEDCVKLLNYVRASKDAASAIGVLLDIGPMHSGQPLPDMLELIREHLAPHHEPRELGEHAKDPEEPSSVGELMAELHAKGLHCKVTGSPHSDDPDRLWHGTIKDAHCANKVTRHGPSALVALRRAAQDYHVPILCAVCGREEPCDDDHGGSSARAKEPIDLKTLVEFVARGPDRCPFENDHGPEGCAYCPQERS